VAIPGLAADDIRRAELPWEVREASGLAVAGENAVLLHNDETGAIYTLDLGDLRVAARSGNPDLAGDFEGIAVWRGDVYLSSSEGDLFRFAPGEDPAPPAYRWKGGVRTGLRGRCEFEGLAALDDLLLLPCKRILPSGDDNTLLIYAYAPDDERLQRFLVLPRSEVPGAEKFKVTALEADAKHLYVLSDRQVIRIDRADRSTRVYKLSKKRHPKPEGLAVMPDGRIVVVDDRKKKASHVTVYAGLHALEEVRED
jgi:hypothetical protein